MEYRIKTVLLGDSGVGKTSFLECFKNGPRPSRVVTTTTGIYPIYFIYLTSTFLGPEYVSHKFIIDDKVLKVNIWDTAGQEKFRALNKNFYREAKGGIIVVDLSAVPKTGSLEYWYNEFKSHADPKAQIMLIGNKADLEKEEDTVVMLNEFAKKMQIPYFEVSALTGLNIENSMFDFTMLIKDVFCQDNTEDNCNSPTPNMRNARNFQSSVRLDATVISEKDEASVSGGCCGSK